MPMDFPSSPTIGQQYNGYVWTGTAWDSTSAQPISLSTTAPGYNAIINGGFDIWQRGTSFTNMADVFCADRWAGLRGAFDAGMNVSQISTSNLAGTRYGARIQRVAGNTSTNNLRFGTTLESAMSIPLAGKTVTLSFYARAGANFSSASNAVFAYLRSGTTIDAGRIIAGDNFGSGAAPVVENNFTLTTSWQRFSMTGTVSSTATQLGVGFLSGVAGTAGTNDYWEITGVQLEEGGAATAFRRNAPSIQAELAACQRYYYRAIADFAGTQFGLLRAESGTNAIGQVMFPVSMRTAPTSFEWSGTAAHFILGGQNCTGLTWLSDRASKTSAVMYPTVASGLAAWSAYDFRANNTTAPWLGFNAEL